MSNETKEYEDQAAELRKLFDEVQEGELKTREHQNEESDEDQDEKIDQERDIDILNLPPRKEVHGNKNTRTRLKIQRPFMRMVFVIIVVVGVLLGLYYVWGEELLNLIQF